MKFLDKWLAAYERRTEAMVAVSAGVDAATYELGRIADAQADLVLVTSGRRVGPEPEPVETPKPSPLDEWLELTSADGSQREEIRWALARLGGKASHGDPDYARQVLREWDVPVGLAG